MKVKKLLSIISFLAFAIFSLIYLVFVIATISIGYYLFTIFMIVAYGLILLALYANRLKNKQTTAFSTQGESIATHRSVISTQANNSAIYTNDDDEYEEDDLDEYLEDEDNDIFDSGYGNWKSLSFGFGQFIKLTGTTFGNRQANISKLKRGSKLIPNYFLYDNKPAIELFLDDLSIGFVPKELSSELTLLSDYLKDIVVREIIGGTSGKSFGVIVDYRLTVSAEDELKEIYKER